MLGCAIALATVLSLTGALASTALAKNGALLRLISNMAVTLPRRRSRPQFGVTSDIFTSWTDDEKEAREQVGGGHVARNAPNAGLASLVFAPLHGDQALIRIDDLLHGYLPFRAE
jgi:hypothetical protein